VLKFREIGIMVNLGGCKIIFSSGGFSALLFVNNSIFRRTPIKIKNK
jgi:hypothetical protein